MSVLRRALLAVPLWMPVSLVGQDSIPLVPPPSDTTPFRRGQWAAQFGIGGSFASLGALRFSSPNRAWVLDGQVRYAWHRDEIRDTVFSIAQIDWSVAINARVGRRFYHRPSSRAVGYTTLGVTGGVSTFQYKSGFGNGENWGWSTGAFAEMGAAYFPSRQLSLGAAASVEGSYYRVTSTGSGVRRRITQFFDVRAAGVSLFATIYF